MGSVAEEYLASFKDQIPRDFSSKWPVDHYALAKLLMAVPKADTEQLLLTHWDYLGYSTLFIQTALYIGTPRCRELADTRIRECPPDVPVLNHIDQHFGVMGVGAQDDLTLDHFERLLPYVDKLDPMSVMAIVQFCTRNAHGDWAREHFLAYLPEGNRRMICPTDRDVVQTLDETADDSKRLPALLHWLERNSGRSLQPEHLLAIVERWLKTSTKPRALGVAAEVIAIIGTRSDLRILESDLATRTVDEEILFRNTRYRVQHRSLH